MSIRKNAHVHSFLSSMCLWNHFAGFRYTRKRAMPASTPSCPLIHEGVFLSPLLLYNVAMNILQQIFSDHYEEIKEPLT